MSIPKKEFYYIRHGETDWNLIGLLMGSTNRPLTSRGIDQAKEATKLVKVLNIKTIVSSPLLRAMQTTETLNKMLNLPVVEMSDLVECYLGNLEGLPDISEDSWNKWRMGEKIHTGEMILEFKTRVSKALCNALEYDKPLIVSHGFVFNAICDILQLDTHGIGNCDLYHIKPTGQSWSYYKVK